MLINVLRWFSEVDIKCPSCKSQDLESFNAIEVNLDLTLSVVTIYIQNFVNLGFFFSVLFTILRDHIVSFSQHQTLSNRFICRCTVVNEFWSIQSGFTLGGPCVSPWSKILQALRGHVQNRGPEIKVWVTSSLFKRTIHMILFNYDISLHY